MATRVWASKIEFKENTNGKPMAYVTVEMQAWDGQAPIIVGVPASNDRDVILEEVRKRLIILFQSAAEDVATGPLTLR